MRCAILSQKSLAIQFSAAAYTETLARPVVQKSPGRTPQGLMGREVASREFLIALLQHGEGNRLEALLASQADRVSFSSHCHHYLAKTQQRRHVRIVPPSEQVSWLADPGAANLHFPFPPDPSIAWRRGQTDRPRFAISGVTHTLCSQRAMQTIWQSIWAPWLPCDRLICTSLAVASMVRDTVQAMIEQIAITSKLRPTWKLALEVCPLGVDTQLHRPAIATKRFEARRRLGITADKFVMLFSGRLSHHSKAQPLPMFVAAQYVAEQLGNDVCMILSGWFSNDIVRHAYEATARRVAPNVRLSIVDGMDAWWRKHAWDAADVFVSLADSIQETFGLTPLEAMSRGIPVVVSDWNGYRDIVEHGQTGFLIPTTMVSGANAGLTDRLSNGEVNYDHFLASAGQTVNVSINAACQSLLSLAKQPELRHRFASAGRTRAVQNFSWPTIIARYEAIWQSQREQLAEQVGKLSAGGQLAEPQQRDIEPAFFYPPIDIAFRSYPTRWVSGDQVLSTVQSGTVVPTVQKQLGQWLHSGRESIAEYVADLFADPLCNHSLCWKGHFARLQNDYQTAPGSLSLAEWSQRWQQLGIPTSDVANVLAWFCKYGALVPTETTEQATGLVESAQGQIRTEVYASGPQDQRFSSTQSRDEVTLQTLITFVTTCKGRLDDLKQTLPRTAKQPRSCLIVVDYSCPQHAGEWVRANFPEVRVVSVPDKLSFDRSDAKNVGGIAVETPWLCLLDCDIVLNADFVKRVIPLLQPNAILRSDQVVEGTGGTFLCTRDMFHRVGGHDPVFKGWGEEDEDLVDALKFAGGQLVYYPANLIQHLPHDDRLRVQFHDDKTRAISHSINRIYRSFKWDWSRLAAAVPPLAARQRLHQAISDRVHRLQATETNATVEISLGSMSWNPLHLPCQRVLQYRLSGSAKPPA